MATNTEDKESDYESDENDSPPPPPPQVKKKTLLKVAAEGCAKKGQALPIEDFEQYLKITHESQPHKQRSRNNSANSDDYEDEQRRRKGSNDDCEISSHKTSVPRKGSMFDASNNLDMWEDIMAKSFMGAGVLKKAVVFNLECGGVYACSPPDFMPTVQQVKALSVASEHLGVIAKKGIKIADEVYSYKIGELGVSMTGMSQTGKDYFYMRYGNFSGMAVVFDRRLRDESVKLADDLHKYFIEVYNF